MLDATPHENLVHEKALVSKLHARDIAPPAELLAQFRVGDFFLVRSPVRPLQQFADLAERGSFEESLEVLDPEARWASRCAALSIAVREAFDDPALCEALYFASPDLEQMLRQETAVALSPKFVRTLTRYFARAAARETPFGLFASVSFGRVTNNVCLEFAANSNCRHTSVAMSYLHQILNELAAGEGVRDSVPRELNSTLTRSHNCFRFAARESKRSLGNSLIEVDVSALLERVVRRISVGTTPDQLARALARGRMTYEDALQVARLLCEREFLVPSWLPAVTGAGSLALAVRELEQHATLSEAAQSFRAVEAQLRHADATAIGAGADSYRRVSDLLHRLCAPATDCHPFQTELGRNAPKLSIDERLAGRFLAAANVLQRTGVGYRSPELAAFRTRLFDRYQGRWVPLSEALDHDLGIGFGQPDALEAESLLEDLPFRVPAGDSHEGDSFERARQRLLHRALASSTQVVQLDEEILSSLSAARPTELPESIAVLARLAQDAQGNLFLVTPMISAPSAVSTLARFCSAQPELEPALRRLVALEQQLAGDTLLADVAYFPGADSSNIVVRPVLRELEIPYFGKSGASPEQQLAISDLLVGVEAGRVVLYSARHRKRIKIRISNALNSTHVSHPVLYRFLAALQIQDVIGLVPRWSWGSLETAPFLPRVVYQSTVLCLATWRLSARELKPLLEAGGARAFTLVQTLRRELRLPRFLNRGSTDDRLLVDLDNELSVDELLHAARNQAELVLEELLPTPDGLVVRGPEGTLAAELVVPFLRRVPAVSAPGPVMEAPEAMASRERLHAPGSSWLFAKVYAGRSQLDSIIDQLREEVVEPLLGTVVKSWFYLPYADPEPHLRLRLKGPPSKLMAQVLPALHRALAPLLKRGLVWRWQVDTYDREVERYGGIVGVQLAERIFCADSEAVCRLHEVVAGDGDLRWQVALLGIDRLLCDAGLSLSERASIAERARRGYGLEQGATPATWKAAGDKYRRFAPNLAQLLWQPKAQLSGPFHRAQAVFDERSTHNVAIWLELRAARQTGALSASDTDLLLSFAHLHAVRVLGTVARRFELVLYDFLRRLYTARAAQNGVRGASEPS